MKPLLIFNFVLVKAVLILVATILFLSAIDARVANFTTIGTADGKTYFAEQALNMSWNETKSFCNVSGMHLATITSDQQRKLLDEASWTTPGSYWTGGRDSQTASQFVWDLNNETLSANFSAPVVYRPVLTCVYYYTPNKRFGTEACAVNYKPLCELIHG